MKPSSPDTPTLSRLLDIATLDRGGASIRIEPDQNERRAIAARLGVPAINRLRGDFRLTPIADGVDLSLALEAEIERRCVISLESMVESIRETIRTRLERTFVVDDGDPTDIEFAREPLEGDEIDLGELLVQHLSLALDPYPRKENAEELLSEYRDAALDSPFAGLEGLVDRDR